VLIERTMLAILSLAGLGFGAGLWLMVKEIRRAPMGYQDESGFHVRSARPVPATGRVSPRVEHARAA
jgi:hypothetical protein